MVGRNTMKQMIVVGKPDLIHEANHKYGLPNTTGCVASYFAAPEAVLRLQTMLSWKVFAKEGSILQAGHFMVCQRYDASLEMYSTSDPSKKVPLHFTNGEYISRNVPELILLNKRLYVLWVEGEGLLGSEVRLSEDRLAVRPIVDKTVTYMLEGS